MFSTSIVRKRVSLSKRWNFTQTANFRGASWKCFLPSIHLPIKDALSAVLVKLDLIELFINNTGPARDPIPIFSLSLYLPPHPISPTPSPISSAVHHHDTVLVFNPRLLSSCTSRFPDALTAASLVSEPSEQNVRLMKPPEGRENLLRVADCTSRTTINNGCPMYITFEV